MSGKKWARKKEQANERRSRLWETYIGNGKYGKGRYRGKEKNAKKKKKGYKPGSTEEKGGTGCLLLPREKGGKIKKSAALITKRMCSPKEKRKGKRLPRRKENSRLPSGRKKPPSDGRFLKKKKPACRESRREVGKRRMSMGNKQRRMKNRKWKHSLGGIYRQAVEGNHRSRGKGGFGKGLARKER